MALRRIAMLTFLVIAAGCIHHQEADKLHEASIRNRARIAEVALGQSFADVQAILGTPQSREAVRTSRGDEETWGYLIDYDRSIMSAVIFVDGKVVEIREVPWIRGRHGH